jgi:hypothetical protein
MATYNFDRPFDELQRILAPWLGEVFCHGLSAWPEDVFCLLSEIKGRGFTRLVLQNRDADPAWIRSSWRTYTETECPRCKYKITAMLRTHKTGRTLLRPVL